MSEDVSELERARRRLRPSGTGPYDMSRMPVGVGVRMIIPCCDPLDCDDATLVRAVRLAMEARVALHDGKFELASETLFRIFTL